MKIALLFGSSGLIGGHLLNQLIKDGNYSKIKLFVRAQPKLSDPKLEIINTDFNNLQNHKEDVTGNDCFFCVGTTKKKTPNNLDYQRLELDIPLEVAKLAKLNSINSFIFVSAIYANPRSSSNYLRFKGLVEEELKKLNFSKLAIMRPSFLMGDRKETRVSEKIGIYVFNLFSPLLLGSFKKMVPIHSEIVAKAMISVIQNDSQQTIFESNEIVEIINH